MVTITCNNCGKEILEMVVIEEFAEFDEDLNFCDQCREASKEVRRKINEKYREKLKAASVERDEELKRAGLPPDSSRW